MPEEAYDYARERAEAEMVRSAKDPDMFWTGHEMRREPEPSEYEDE